jgi:hypothetical protein
MPIRQVGALIKSWIKNRNYSKEELAQTPIIK